MQFEIGILFAVAVIITAISIDWPRALVGLVFGTISHNLPYGTIVVPVGSAVIAAVGEFVYPVIGRTAEPSLGSFVIGFCSVAGAAGGIHVTLRNLKDRL